MRRPLDADIGFQLEEVDRVTALGGDRIEDQAAEHFTLAAELHVNGEGTAAVLGLLAHPGELLERQRVAVVPGCRRHPISHLLYIAHTGPLVDAVLSVQLGRHWALTEVLYATRAKAY